MFRARIHPRYKSHNEGGSNPVVGLLLPISFPWERPPRRVRAASHQSLPEPRVRDQGQMPCATLRSRPSADSRRDLWDPLGQLGAATSTAAVLLVEQIPSNSTCQSLRRASHPQRRSSPTKLLLPSPTQARADAAFCPLM